MPRGRGAVTRFVVMAMLQAARAQTLGLKQESAYSWGLNRAIFYAAAKRGFRGTPSTLEGAPKGEGQPLPPRATREPYYLGDEEAYRDPKSETLLFTIGDKDQTGADFQKQIASRFETKGNFRAAWDEAVRVVKSYDRATLESRQHFFHDVYKPRRDELSEIWSREYAPSATAERH
ncbi:MAG: hypothetical protein WCB19_09810 [Thermoplasmata archaeon]